MCVCVREREREREREKTKNRNTQDVYITKKENNHHITKWEEGALYSHHLSSLTTRHMKYGECGSS